MIHVPTPIQEIHSTILEKKEVRLWVKRDDLTHLHIQGNKWRKLKYNLEAFKHSHKKYLLTFGGAFSNHIYATAAAGQLFGIPTIGIIRGEKIYPLNPTLAFAEQAGMQLFFVDRIIYREKEQALSSLNISTEACYILPEGGTNDLALQGCEELADEILDQTKNFSPDFICLPCGTGGTAAGILSSEKLLKQKTHLLAFSALKGDFLKKEIHRLQSKNKNWSLQTDYHFGGYAKFSEELIHFINEFKQQYHISLDPVYTGKMFYGIFDLIEKNFFKKGSQIIAIHTGGLQGILGFNQRFGNILII